MPNIKDSSDSNVIGQALQPALAREWLIGESRVNLIRMSAIALFYLQHWVLHSQVDEPSSAELTQHAIATMVVVIWGLSAALLQITLARAFRPALSYVVTAIDLLLVSTVVVTSSTGGPTSSLIAIYFLVIGASVLRFSLPLVYFTTILTVLLYLFVLGHHVFVVIGYEQYYSDDFAANRIPRSMEIVFGLSLLMSGVIAAQAVRQAKRLATTVSDICMGELEATRVVEDTDEQLVLVLQEEDSE